MKKDFLVNEKYLNIPICAQKDEKLLRLYLLDRKTCNQFRQSPHPLSPS